MSGNFRPRTLLHTVGGTGLGRRDSAALIAIPRFAAMAALRALNHLWYIATISALEECLEAPGNKARGSPGLKG